MPPSQSPLTDTIVGCSRLLGLLALLSIAGYLVGSSCALAPLPSGPPSRDPRPAPRLSGAGLAAFDAHAAASARGAYHHISLCSYAHPKFALLQRTAAWHGDSVQALGMGDPRFQKWGIGFGVKLEQVQLWLARPEVAPDDVVLFTDAFDVLLMAGSAEIRAAYLAASRRAMVEEADPAAEAAGLPPRVPTLLFSTERFCWPDAGRASAYPASDRRHEFAFLNSGTYIGRAGDLAASMARLNYTIDEDDQRFWTSLYFASREDYSRPRIVLDHAADVFLCMSGLRLGEDVVYEPALRRYRPVRAPGLPLVMHFNNAKREVARFFDALQGRLCPEHSALRACTLMAALPPALALLALGIMAGRCGVRASPWLQAVARQRMRALVGSA